MRTRTLALLLLVAACHSTNPGAPDSGGALADLAGANPDPADFAGVLYTASFVSASATTLRYVLDHNPNNEGSSSDVDWPAQHDFRQQLTVDIPVDDALRHFVCIVFAGATPPTSYAVDASLGNLNHYGFSLVDTNGGTQRWQNVSDLCRIASLPVVVWPNLVTFMPDVAVMIPLMPDPHALTAGAPVSGWLARGLLGNDEQGELVPVIHGMVVKVETHACSDPAGPGC